MTNGETPVLLQSEELAIGAKLTNLATKRASADPLPGPTKEAFCSGPITVAGKTVYPVVPRYFQALRAIDSPLISIIEDVVQTGKVETELPDEAAWEVCWIFTHTGKEVRAMLAKGPKAINEIACEEVGETDYPVALVLAAAFTQIQRNMKTAIEHHAEAAQEGSITFLTDSEAAPPVETGGS